MYRTVKPITLAFLINLVLALIAAAQVHAAQLTLSWTDNSTDETGFRIERKTGTSGTYAEIALVGANVVSYVDSSLANATNYCYRLRAYNSAGNSSYSNEQCATTASAPTPTSFLLTVNKNGAGTGTVTGTGINCGSDCSESLVSGTQVVLTAAPANGSTFAGWTGTGCGSGTVTLTSNVTCTATFNLATFTLTVAKAGNGGGTVTGTGIDCGSDCTHSASSGTQVVLSAAPATGSTFAGWTGTGCGSGTVTLSSNVTCTATFNLATFTLTEAKAGNGGGTVTGTGINCGSDCTHSASSGTQVVLSAAPATGATFAGWTGTGCGSGTVTLTSNVTCTATFNLVTFTLTVLKAGNGSGTVTGTGINCGSDCTHSASSGTQVVLSAAPATSSTFAGWTGTGCSSGAVTLTTNVTCTATFNSAVASGDRIGVYRPSSGTWFLDTDGNYSWEDDIDTTVPAFTAAASQPVLGDWSQTGNTQLGLFQPSTRQWHLDINNNKTIDGCNIDACEGPFGETNDIAVVGNWNNRGED
ncbi:MAG TPA: hypothetical protein VHM64_20800, partial [Candidatus Binatia bacterium]|nr:hypothetical protein [Candidatus Binatia bacterium]